MKQFKVYKEGNVQMTLVSNVFIDSYMKDANDAQLKIYLFLLRTMGAHRTTSVSDLADFFNYTEKDVIRALKYWESKKLLKAEYDEHKNLVGIRLLEVTNSEESSHDIRSEFVALAPVISLPIAESSTAPDKAETLSVSANPLPEKPVYSADELLSFKKDESSSQLIFVVEQYLGRPLSANDFQTLMFLTDKLHFSEDLIDYLFQYCVGRNKKDFRYIEKVAMNWSAEGIKTVKQAMKCTSKYDKIVYDIMKAFGKSNNPTDAEADYCKKWTKDMGFSKEIILEACRKTVLATDNHRFEYADRILNCWYKNHVQSKNDISLLDEAFARDRNSQKTVQSNSGVFNQYMRHDYDIAAIEKNIVSN